MFPGLPLRSRERRDCRRCRGWLGWLSWLGGRASQQLLAHNRYLGGRCDADLHPLALNREHRYTNHPIQDDAFTDFSSQYEHVDTGSFPSVVASVEKPGACAEQPAGAKWPACATGRHATQTRVKRY